MSLPSSQNSRGFTLLELMIGMALFLVISGAVLGGMGTFQANYRKAELRTILQQRLRATMELMSQEIGQAGLQGSSAEGDILAATGGAPYNISAVPGVGTYSPTVTPSISGIYVGQWLQVDGGAYADPVQVTAVGSTTNPPTITALFGNTQGHIAGTPMYPMGVFPHGVLGDLSNSTRLLLYGAIRGGGSGLFAVEYQCPATYPGSVTRSEWDLSQVPPLLKSQQVPLIDNVTYCQFNFPSSTDSVSLAGPSAECPQLAAAGNANFCTYSIITQVSFTVTATVTTAISGSAQPITITKSYANIQPRNLIAADNIYKLACTSAINSGNNCTDPRNYKTYIVGELQIDPSNLASVSWF